MFSNHASGTAIDLNWQKFPMFKRNMNKKQEEACRAIVKDCEGLIRWGGDYKTGVDQMHFEIADKVKPEAIASFVKRKKIKADGSVPISSSGHSHIRELLGGK